MSQALRKAGPNQAARRPEHPAIRKIDIMGVGVVDATQAQAIALVDDMANDRAPVGVAFLNAHASNVAARNADFSAALDRLLVLNDGIGVDVAARLLAGRRFAGNLNGTDFLPAYLAQTRHRHRVFLLGGRPGVAERAAARLQTFGAHEFVGTRDGYFPAADAQAVARQVHDSGATLLLVALGNPAQELWIDRHLDATGARVAFGVGALFDFMAGEVPRAPAWMRRHGLEWVFRLSNEPRRLFARYVIGNPGFLLRALRYRLTNRRG